MEKICKSFGANNVLTEVNFKLGAGEMCALLGDNGTGKTTFIRVLLGEHAHGRWSGRLHPSGAEPDQ